MVFESEQSLSRVRLFATLRTVAYQAPQSMDFSKQEYWSEFTVIKYFVTHKWFKKKKRHLKDGYKIQGHG